MSWSCDWGRSRFAFSARYVASGVFRFIVLLLLAREAAVLVALMVGVRRSGGAGSVM
jgi:NADH:ubiquinone oxidoreductase subunit K